MRSINILPRVCCQALADHDFYMSMDRYGSGACVGGCGTIRNNHNHLFGLSVRAYVRAYVRACVRACVRVCLCVHARAARARACVCVCVCVPVCVRARFVTPALWSNPKEANN